VLPGVNLNVPGRNNSTLDEKFVTPRARDHVLKVAGQLPSILKACPKADNSNGLIALLMMRSNSGLGTSNSSLDLLIPQPKWDAISHILLDVYFKYLIH
jgi:hypothetical protein